MKAMDRFLQSWRIGQARNYIKPGMRVLDIGSADGALFKQIQQIGCYIGIDPDLPAPVQLADNARLVSGLFPDAVRDAEPFDCITLLAVLEHIPSDQQQSLASDCAAYLKPGGHLVITVPSPNVDYILTALRFFHIIDGMSLEEHYGFEAKTTPEIFTGAGLELRKKKRFQLGLNHLFVFTRPLSNASRAFSGVQDAAK